MASSEVRVTYSLDEETAVRLSHLAHRWNVSESEALKRAVRAADADTTDEDRIAALDALQSSMKLSSEAAESWARNVREERRSSLSRP